MNRKMYFILVLVVVGVVVFAGIVSLPHKRKSSNENSWISPSGKLVYNFNITGDGSKRINVTKNWTSFTVVVIYDPATVSKDSYVRLYDPYGHMENDFGLEHVNIDPGSRLKSSAGFNLAHPPITSPPGIWMVKYHLPNNAVVNIKVYATCENSTA